MIDKIPIKTLLDHAKQPFIPYTTAKSVMWDGTDKTLYDVVMEGVPIPDMPDISELVEYPVHIIDVAKDLPFVLENFPNGGKGIYVFIKRGSSGTYNTRIRYKLHESDSDSNYEFFDTAGFMIVYQSVEDFDIKLAEGVRDYGIFTISTNGPMITTLDHNNSYYSRDFGMLNTLNTGTSDIKGTLKLAKLPQCTVVPSADNHLVNKLYVDGAITEALASYTPTVDLTNYYTKEEIDTELGERDTALNADIMVAINAAGRAEMEVQNKQNKVTYGTGDPSGGSDGDVYFKYTA